MAKRKRQPKSSSTSKRKYLDKEEQVQAVIYAEVHGDAAAMERYNVAARTLRKYRSLVRQEGAEHAKLFRLYQKALERPDQRANSYADYLEQQARQTSALLLEKLEALEFRNPEHARVLNDHFVAIGNQVVDLTFLTHQSVAHPLK